MQGVHYIPDLMREAMREAGGGKKKERKKNERKNEWLDDLNQESFSLLCTFAHLLVEKTHPFSSTS